jgi:hypothetical protein
MNKPDKSSKARAALDQLFSGMAPADATRASRPGNPFEASADGASADTGGRGGIEVTLSTRIQLRGYPNANAFMKRMAEAWGLEWGMYDSVKAIATLPVGWRARRLPEVTQIVDGHDVLGQVVEGVRRSGSRRPRLELLRDRSRKVHRSARIDDLVAESRHGQCAGDAAEMAGRELSETPRSFRVLVGLRRGVVILRGCPVRVRGHAPRDRRRSGWGASRFYASAGCDGSVN